MVVSEQDIKKAMNTLGITDVHVELSYVKKVHRKLLLKWHPDSCPEGKAAEYTKKSAEINAAFDVIEKAFKMGYMGPSAKGFSEASGSYTADNTANDEADDDYSYGYSTNESYEDSDSSEQQYEYNYNYYNNNYYSYQNNYENYKSDDFFEKYYEAQFEARKKQWQKRYEEERNIKLVLNAFFNSIFYARCFLYMYCALVDFLFNDNNMLVKEAPYNLAMWVLIFGFIKSIIFALIGRDYSDEELSKIKLSGGLTMVSFFFPWVYAFVHKDTAAMIFFIYFTGWAVIEWIANIRIYTDSEGSNFKMAERKSIRLGFYVFLTAELITIAFGVFVIIAAISIK